mmetsp:Transcript_32586/g.56477  ORF Transcript_32586/g.56477 Transcript_32586/m.56477 type:complete len:180 (-) Transcript_32586:2240-2779(-)
MGDEEWSPPFREVPPEVDGVELWDNEGYLSPFVPTGEEKMDKAFSHVQFNESDVFYDLGCGDGRTLFKAISLGCPRAVGVDIDPTLCEALRQKIEEEGLSDRISVIQGSMLDIDFSQMTVLWLYLLPKAQVMLQEPLQAAFDTGRLRKILCNTFELKGMSVHKEYDSSLCFYFYEKNKT